MHMSLKQHAFHLTVQMASAACSRRAVGGEGVMAILSLCSRGMLSQAQLDKNRNDPVDENHCILSGMCNCVHFRFYFNNTVK